MSTKVTAQLNWNWKVWGNVFIVEGYNGLVIQEECKSAWSSEPSTLMVMWVDVNLGKCVSDIQNFLMTQLSKHKIRHTV